MESQLRELADAAGIERELGLDKILRRLTVHEVIDERAAKGLGDFINLGNRVAAGAQVTPEAFNAIQDEGLGVIYALQELTRLSRENPNR